MTRTARTVRSAVTAATMVTALALTGCGGSGSGQAKAGSEQTLTVWVMGEEGNRIQPVAKEFTAKHPNITVKVTPVGWDVAHQKLLSAAAAGTLPDMAQMGSTMMGEFIELGSLEPVDTKVFDENDFFPATWKGNVVDGTAYGVPWYADTRALYYRTDLAEKAGTDKTPATWKDMRAMAAAYKNRAGTDWGLSLQPGGAGAWQGWAPFLFSAGGSLLGKDGRPALDSPESVEALTEFQHYFDAGLAKKNFVPGQDVVKDFAADRMPMFVSGPWIVQNLAEQPELKGKWKVAPVPAGKSSTSWVGGASLVTFKDSGHRAAAQEFTKFLTTPEMQAHWYEISKALPANKAAWDQPALKNGGDSLAVFEKSLATAKDIPPLPKWEEFTAQIDSALEKVSAGADPAATAAKLQKDTEGLLD